MRSLVFISERELLAGVRLSSLPTLPTLDFFEAVDLSVWVKTRGGAWNDSAEAIGEMAALRARGKDIRLHASLAEGDLDGDIQAVADEILAVVARFGGCDLFHLNAERVWRNGKDINEKLALLAAALRAGGIPKIGYSGHRHPPWMYGAGTEDLDHDIMRDNYDVLLFMAYNVKGSYDATGRPWILRKLTEGEVTAGEIGLPYEPLIGTGRIDEKGVWGWVEVTEPFLVAGAEASTVGGVSAYFANGSRVGDQDTLWDGSNQHISIEAMFSALDCWSDLLPEDEVRLQNADDALHLAQSYLAACKTTGAVRRATNATTNARAAVARAIGDSV